MLKAFVVNRNNLFTGLVIILAAILGLFISFAAQVEISAEHASYDTWVQVNESDGQNISAGIATGEGMAFGEMVQGTNITKSLELSSEKLALVQSSAEGNISKGLHFEEKVLFQNETEIRYKYAGEEPGYYEGSINLELKTADNTWGERWLRIRYQLPF